MTVPEPELGSWRTRQGRRAVMQGRQTPGQAEVSLQWPVLAAPLSPPPHHCHCSHPPYWCPDQCQCVGVATHPDQSLLSPGHTLVTGHYPVLHIVLTRLQSRYKHPDMRQGTGQGPLPHHATHLVSQHCQPEHIHGHTLSQQCLSVLTCPGQLSPN